MLVPVVCVLVILSEKRGRTKVNVEENHCNEQLVEGTVFGSEHLTPLNIFKSNSYTLKVFKTPLNQVHTLDLFQGSFLLPPQVK